ncbi:MAG: phenylpropionate dioxygenase-like ring-hydroxylating dioxygenase large terminal subunit [Candidatus Azotimanducaceae bacterium]|jgi:phenylpropionate dioxygenase-like ring-hydroxylating dioxygenase large terminal subunit
MLVTKQPVLRRFWYTTVPLSYLDQGPVPFTLLGENLVIWKDAEGNPAATQDRCSHRTAKLSKGYVENGNIVCGYHGWTYNRDGACVHLPQAPEQTEQREIRVPAYHCMAQNGYAWVCLDEPLQPPPNIPEESMAGVRRIDQFYELWDTSSLRFLENAFDNAHFSYVHRSTFGDQQNPLPSSYELNEHPWGFESKTTVEILNPPDSHILTGTTEPRTLRYLNNSYHLPFARRFGCSYPSGLIHTIFNCATPIDDNRIMLSQWLYRNDSEEQAPADVLNAFDRRVTDEDREILESTDPNACVDVSRRREKHMVSDRPGLLIRKLLMDLLHAHDEEEVYE